MTDLTIKSRTPIVFILFGLFFIFIHPAFSRADLQESLNQCIGIEDDLLRLQCYDEMAKKKVSPVKTMNTCLVPVPVTPSYLSQLWELDTSQSRGKLSVKMHRSNYILPFSYNFSPNEEPIKAASSYREVLKPEVAFQLSIKTKIWEDIMKKDMDLWVAYTQRSFWQLYNFDESAPFRETNYEPELLLNLPMNLNLAGINLRTINFGLNHQSNGRAEPLSRSWNRIVANLGFEKQHLFSKQDSLVLELKSWYRIPESKASDDNPNIEDYLGYGEIWGYYFRKNHRFSMMIRNNLNSDQNRGAMQLGWTFPLNNRVSGYLQYYLGYGESLLDYNHSVNRLGLGFMLTDWN